MDSGIWDLGKPTQFLQTTSKTLARIQIGFLKSLVTCERIAALPSLRIFEFRHQLLRLADDYVVMLPLLGGLLNLSVGPEQR